MVILEISRHIIGLVCTGDISGIGDMVPVDTRGQSNTRFPLLGELVVHISVVGQLRTRRCMVSNQIHAVSNSILQFNYRTPITQAVLNQVDTIQNSSHPVLVGNGHRDILEGYQQSILEIHTVTVHIAGHFIDITHHLVQVKTGQTPFQQVLGTNYTRRLGNIIGSNIETGTQFMRNTALHVIIIEERVNIEIMLVTAHVR